MSIVQIRNKQQNGGTNKIRACSKEKLFLLIRQSLKILWKKVAFCETGAYMGFRHLEAEVGGHSRSKQREQSQKAKHRIYM